MAAIPKKGATNVFGTTLTTTNVGGATILGTVAPSMNFPDTAIVKTIQTPPELNGTQGLSFENSLSHYTQVMYRPTTKEPNGNTIFNIQMPDYISMKDAYIQIPVYFTLNRIVVNDTEDDIGTLIYNWKNFNSDSTVHTVGGCILNLFRNLKIRIGTTDLLASAEKNPYIQELNAWLNKNMYDMDSLYKIFNNDEDCNSYGVNSKQNNRSMQEGFHPHKNALSDHLLDSGLMWCNEAAGGGTAWVLNTNTPDLMQQVRLKRILTIPLGCFHSLFNQSITLPAGLQIQIEFTVPNIVSEAEFGNPGLNQPSGQWVPIMHLPDGVSERPDPANPNAIKLFDCTQPADFTTWRNLASAQGGEHIQNNCTGYMSPILVLASTDVNNSDFVFSCTAGVYKPEIIQALNTYRIANALLYNAIQYTKYILGTYANIVSFDYHAPTNTNIPQEYLLYFANSMSYFGPVSGDIPNNLTYGPRAGVVHFQDKACPVSYRRVIANRAGYQDYTLYNNYYNYTAGPSDQWRLTTMGYCAASGVVPAQYNSMLNTKTYGVLSLCPHPSSKFLQEQHNQSWQSIQWQNKPGMDRYMAFPIQSYGQKGTIIHIPLNPGKVDLGYYNADQRAYVVRFIIDIESADSRSASRQMLFNTPQITTNLYLVKRMPIQITVSYSNEVNVVVWPNIISSMSANQPSAFGSANQPAGSG